MPYYKDTQNELHFLDDAHFEYLLPAGLVAITDAEADVIIQAKEAAIPPAPTLTLPELQAQLATLTEQIAALAQA